MLFGGGPDNFDFARFSFHVPVGTISCADTEAPSPATREDAPGLGLGPMPRKWQYSGK